MLKQAIFTEPNDQAVWQYRKWFLHKYNVLDAQTVDDILQLEPEAKYALFEKAESSNDPSIWLKLAKMDALRMGYYKFRS